jgi:hypothetical protein
MIPRCIFKKYAAILALSVMAVEVLFAKKTVL